MECIGTTYHMIPVRYSGTNEIMRIEHRSKIDELVGKITNEARFPRDDQYDACRLMAKEIDAILRYRTEGMRMANKFIAWAETNGRLESIALFTVEFHRFYIDYLCSARPRNVSTKCKHVTTRLLAYIHNAARLAGVNRIETRSASTSLPFYQKVGMIQSPEDNMHFYHTNLVQDSRIHRARARGNAQIHVHLANEHTRNALERAEQIVKHVRRGVVAVNRGRARSEPKGNARRSNSEDTVPLNSEATISARNALERAEQIVKNARRSNSEATVSLNSEATISARNALERAEQIVKHVRRPARDRRAGRARSEPKGNARRLKSKATESVPSQQRHRKQARRSISNSKATKSVASQQQDRKQARRSNSNSEATESLPRRGSVNTFNSEETISAAS